MRQDITGQSLTWLGLSMNSSNGWPVSLDKSSIVNYMVPGTKRHFSCRTSVAPILINFAAEIHKLEPIDVGVFDDWGWYVRKVRGSKSKMSNHASGTAIDINSTKHGWKATRSGYTKKQESIIDILCFDFGIRWGWRYKFGFKDPMHFEIIESKLQVKERIAAMKLSMPKEKTK